LADVIENGRDRDSDAADLAEVGIYATARRGFEHGLVVLSMGLAYWLVRSDEGFRLLVERPVAGRVREELDCFDRESVGWPPRPLVERAPKRGHPMLTPLLWALAELAAFNLQDSAPAFSEGRFDLDSRALFDGGEWWRPATALFLHADAGHLTANLIFGFIVFTAVVSTFGAGRAWLLVAVASISGNIAVAAANYPGPYRSLGASTAIFAGFGLLTGRAIRVVRRAHPPRRWYPILVPLLSGTALLAFLGAGGGNTDVAAHGCGFAAGLFLGLAAPGRLPETPDSGYTP
jgi:membrane associated rhomboid family serine protease